MSLPAATFSERILSAVLNGGYQGVLLTLVIGLALKAIPRSNAATRHAVWLTVLGVLAALPIAHFLQSGGDVSKPTVAARGQRLQPPEAVGASAAAEERMGENPGIEPFDPVDSFEGKMSLLPSAVTSNTWKRTEGRSDIGLQGTEELSALDRLQLKFWTPRPVAIFLVILWAFLSALRLSRLAWEYLQLRRLLAGGTPAVDDLAELFGRCREEAGVISAVRLVITPKATAPMAVGLLHHAVVLPGGEALRRSPHLGDILRHELAHLRRKDDWANLAQQIVLSLFFFHPGVRWISSRLSIEREIACDDHVLALSGERKPYALFLTEFAGRKHGRSWAAAPAAWKNKEQLKERIRMILDWKRNASPRLARARAAAFGFAAVMLAAAAFWIGPRVAIAAEENGLPAAPAASAAPAAPGTVVISPSGTLVATTPAVPKVPRSVILAQAEEESAPKVKGGRGAAGGDSSIERRLERLEKMVESLVARERPQPPAPGNLRRLEELDREKLGKMGEKLHKAGLDEEQTRRIMDQVRRDVERATRETERAVKEAQRAAQDAQEFAARQEFPDARKNLEAQRRALEAQHRALEKQMGAIEKQLRDLEETERRGEDRESGERERKHKEKERTKDQDDGQPLRK